MSDIVDELRNIQTAPSPYKSLGQLCREAADEIERLRDIQSAALRRLDDMEFFWVGPKDEYWRGVVDEQLTP